MTSRSLQHPGLALLGLVLGACTEPGPATIGYVLPVSWGSELVAVAQDAVDSLWPEGPAPVRVVTVETVTGGAAEREIALAEELLRREDPVAVVGHGGSRESLLAAPVYNEAGVLQVVPTGTSRRFRDAGPWTFALAPDDSLEAEFIAAEAIRRWGPASVTIFYVNDAYGVGLAMSVRDAFGRRGVTITDALPVNEQGDVAALTLASLRRSRPDLVVAATRPEATGRLARAVHAFDPGLQVIAGDGAFIFPRLLDSVGPAAPQVAVVGFWDPTATDSASQAFVARFRRVAGRRPHASAAMAFDALMLLARAVDEVGARPRAIRGYLQSLGAERAAYVGVTGPISFQRDRPGRFVLLNLAQVAGRLRS